METPKLPPIFALAKKIQIARSNFLALGLRKVKDEFNGTSSYDSDEVIHHALQILDELNIFSLVSVDATLAVLKALDLDGGGDVQITYPALGMTQERLRALLLIQLLELHEENESK